LVFTRNTIIAILFSFINATRNKIIRSKSTNAKNKNAICDGFDVPVRNRTIAINKNTY
jgi:hypothetical protein